MPIARAPGARPRFVRRLLEFLAEDERLTPEERNEPRAVAIRAKLAEVERLFDGDRVDRRAAPKLATDMVAEAQAEVETLLRNHLATVPPPPDPVLDLHILGMLSVIGIQVSLEQIAEARRTEEDRVVSWAELRLASDGPRGAADGFVCRLLGGLSFQTAAGGTATVGVSLGSLKQHRRGRVEATQEPEQFPPIGAMRAFLTLLHLPQEPYLAAFKDAAAASIEVFEVSGEKVDWSMGRSEPPVPESPCWKPDWLEHRETQAEFWRQMDVRYPGLADDKLRSLEQFALDEQAAAPGPDLKLEMVRDYIERLLAERQMANGGAVARDQ